MKLEEFTFARDSAQELQSLKRLMVALFVVLMLVICIVSLMRYEESTKRQVSYCAEMMTNGPLGKMERLTILGGNTGKKQPTRVWPQLSFQNLKM